MRTTKIVSITLPPPLYEQAKAMATEENRTMSELMREALRRYGRDRLYTTLREKVTPVAEKQGVRTEDDVVRVIREFRREKQAARAAVLQERTGTRS